jgi:diadenosine tetraphosphate (Ap4A) HIT family hydrolase
MDCPFCAIVQRHDTAIIFENAWCIAILPKRMEAFGHLIVLSKIHVETIIDMPIDALQGLIQGTQEVAKLCRKNLCCDGINILHASGEAAEQSINHVHLHLIPRFKGDHIHAWPHLPGTTASSGEIVALFREQ